MNNEIKTVIKQHEAEMIHLRRELHQHPELSFEEFETTKRIAKILDTIGIEYRLTTPTGIIAEIKGGKPGKTVALRADIDALPVMEINDKIDYQSTVPGKMHACGHDAHTSMLVTAAKALHAIKDQLSGNVRLIFQPAEESADANGAKIMIEQGAIDGVDNVFGIHVRASTPSGKISCNVGFCFASTDLLIVKFKGRGGHGSMPKGCVDAAVVASSFVMNLQSIIARETSPLDSAVVTIGRMEAGTGYNVIAENAILEGTVRCFSLEERQRIENAIRRYAEHTAAMYGAIAEVDYQYGTLPVINEERSALLAQSVIKNAFGEEALFNEPPTTGGEDFSYFIENIPGCYALLGTCNPDKNSDFAHHHGSFNIDEDTMIDGAELYAQYAWAYLNQNEF